MFFYAIFRLEGIGLLKNGGLSMDLLLSFLFFYFLIVYTIYHFSTAYRDSLWNKIRIVVGDKEHTIYYCVANETVGDFDNITSRSTTYYLQDEATFNTQFFVASSVTKIQDGSGGSDIKRYYYTVNRTRGEFGSKIKQLALSEDKTKRQETFDKIIEQIEKHRFSYQKYPYKIG